MKKFLKEHYKIILVLVWMIVIFLFSATPGDESSKQSQLVIDILTALGINIEGTFGELASFVVRKSAHMTEYFILCGLIYNAIKGKFKGFKLFVYPLVMTFLYACTDEFHQYFTPGRAAAFKDVMIDTMGATIFVIGLFVIKSIKRKINMEQKAA